ncbi:TPA: hypothetical protein QCR55_000931 [Bacillus cereus]|uniref:hypothetical protein n=1 Tax=unclassified Bacillus (in: firmicutes) TaxID=185979 RepID=UPI002248CE06|nr:hypothetical protein [Bacillus sp. AS_3]MCW4652351.1 hypothetical protein [Bacillus sp. AS_3]MCX2700012.1 hypothetical protein [Bacillus sp. AS_5]HDR4864599.1 hypothetical protein [Bacillus cereus]HDR4877702.1 hypothetical protein [Bacillus cereus]
MNRKAKGINLGLLRQDNEFFVLTLLLILVASSINYTKLGFIDYVGIASTILLVAAIGIKLVANWYINKDS